MRMLIQTLLPTLGIATDCSMAEVCRRTFPVPRSGSAACARARGSHAPAYGRQLSLFSSAVLSSAGTEDARRWNPDPAWRPFRCRSRRTICSPVQST